MGDLSCLLPIVDGDLVRGGGDIGVLGGAASFLRLPIRPNPWVLVHHTYKQRSQLRQVIRFNFCDKLNFFQNKYEIF